MDNLLGKLIEKLFAPLLFCGTCIGAEIKKCKCECKDEWIVKDPDDEAHRRIGTVGLPRCSHCGHLQS